MLTRCPCLKYTAPQFMHCMYDFGHDGPHQYVPVVDAPISPDDVLPWIAELLQGAALPQLAWTTYLPRLEERVRALGRDLSGGESPVVLRVELLTLLAEGVHHLAYGYDDRRAPVPTNQLALPLEGI